jgi:hypothetical protein
MSARRSSAPRDQLGGTADLHQDHRRHRVLAAERGSELDEVAAAAGLREQGRCALRQKARVVRDVSTAETTRDVRWVSSNGGSGGTDQGSYSVSAQRDHFRAVSLPLSATPSKPLSVSPYAAMLCPRAARASKARVQGFPCPQPAIPVPVSFTFQMYETSELTATMAKTFSGAATGPGERGSRAPYDMLGCGPRP